MRTDHAAPWRVIYIARGETQAQAIDDMLRQAGFLVNRKRLPLESTHQDDIEIRVLDSEAEEARLFLMEQGL